MGDLGFVQLLTPSAWGRALHPRSWLASPPDLELRDAHPPLPRVGAGTLEGGCSVTMGTSRDDRTPLVRGREPRAWSGRAGARPGGSQGPVSLCAVPQPQSPAVQGRAGTQRLCC